MATRKRPPRIVVVGSANVDLTSFTDGFPRPGETVFGREFHLGFGGKGANQAVAAARCGAETHLVARVGDDLFGPATLDNLRARGVGARHVRKIRGVSTGVAPIFVDARGENRIVVVKGANDRLGTAAVDAAAPLLRRADAMILQLEIPLATVYHAVRLARRHDVRVILNPAPAAPLDLARVRAVDWLIPNETEAAALTGMPVATLPQARACAAALLEQGFARVVLTLGRRGALLAGPDGIERVPAFAVKPVDTTGAGDAFIGCFATFLAEGLEAAEVVRRANLYAALSTTAVGTQASFPSRRVFAREWRARG